MQQFCASFFANFANCCNFLQTYFYFILHVRTAYMHSYYFTNMIWFITPTIWRDEKHCEGYVCLIHDLRFLPISTIESAVGKRLITHCCVLRLACSRLSGHSASFA